VYVLLPETMGLSLEMIEAKFAASASSPFSWRIRGGRAGEEGGREDETEGLLAWFHRRVCATSGWEQQQQQQQQQQQLQQPAAAAAAAGAGGGATQVFIESLLPVEKQQEQQQEQNQQ
jgi:hypothetical protein